MITTGANTKMVMKSFMTDGQVVVKLTKSFEKAHVPKYIERKGERGRYLYKYAKPEGFLRKLRSRFLDIRHIDKEIDKLYVAVGKLEGEKKKLTEEVKPTFKKLGAEKIQVGKELMSLVEVVKRKIPYKLIVSELYKLGGKAKKLIDGLEKKLAKIISYEKASYRIQKAESGDEKLDEMVKDFKKDLEELLKTKKEISSLFKSKPVEKSYAAMRKWEDAQSQNFPVVDKNPAQYPDEDFAARKKPVRHVRHLPTGKIVEAGHGTPREATPYRSPWGQVDRVDKLADGVWSVSTPGHGGIMVRNDVAKGKLTPLAQSKAIKADGYHSYEEDCDWAIPYLQLNLEGGAQKQAAIEMLSGYNADILQEAGIEPEPEAYARFKQRQEEDKRRESKDPNLIVSASMTDEPDVTKVWTADGKQYLVRGYKEAREAGNFNLDAVQVVSEVKGDSPEDFAFKKKPAGHKGYSRTTPTGKVSQVKEKPYAKEKKENLPVKQVGDYKIYRRTFEAEKYPKGSPERKKLNESGITSEYMHSYRFAIEGPQSATAARTLPEAIAEVTKYDQNSKDPGKRIRERDAREETPTLAHPSKGKPEKSKIPDIHKKFDALVDAYKNEVKTKGYSEDMGRKYERQFKDFVGDEYSYSYDDRMNINSLSQRLSDITSSPIGD